MVPTVAVGTLVGALFMIAVGSLAKMKPAPHPVSRDAALLHAALLAAGCCVLLVLAHWWQLPRTHWALLAFCLMFVPVDYTWRSGLRYAGATASGALGAAALGLLAPSWFDPFVLFAAMVATVTLSLAGRSALSVVPLAAAVVMLGTVLTGESMLDLGVQRTALSLLALLVALGLLGASHTLTRFVGRRRASTAPSR